MATESLIASSSRATAVRKIGDDNHVVLHNHGLLAVGATIPGTLRSLYMMERACELELLSRGPYCGCHGYLGFNRESHLSITIRTAICKDGMAHFNVGAGIVADSNPEAEYEETLSKAAGFLAALNLQMNPHNREHSDAAKPVQDNS